MKQTTKHITKALFLTLALAGATLVVQKAMSLLESPAPQAQVQLDMEKSLTVLP
ncbi:hypothetical protein [Pontibacter sp. G13]|uniref:hypothetical protein n=1 Tax=Pontibacter sp. G13 TaxID=3074898 RepID=UPI00288A188B|nr:hypothetical protein [Pontibacter sp. G13]WNJ17226.1 hypothetical protein RJD25_20410 [Pontibacter sp. G13]